MGDWTFEDDLILHQLWVVKAVPTPVISARLGRSAAAICGRASRNDWRKGGTAPPPTAVMSGASTKPWTDEQREFLILNWRAMQDDELAKAVSEIGPERTILAVENWRRKLGLMRPRGYSPGSQIVTRNTDRSTEDDVWPPLRGTQEGRDKLYLKLLFEGLQAEHARIQARALAKQEAA